MWKGLPALLDTPAAYIGVIGSQRRWAMAEKAMLEQGVPAEKLERVRSPIGLELNAETPEEIAVSILAEIIMLRQGGDGARCRQEACMNERRCIEQLCTPMVSQLIIVRAVARE